jgi:hypothetical protein
MDLPIIINELITAAGNKDWPELEARANEISSFARSAQRVLTEEGTADEISGGNGHRPFRIEDVSVPDLLSLIDLLRNLFEELVYRIPNPLNWQRVHEIGLSMQQLAGKHL